VLAVATTVYSSPRPNDRPETRQTVPALELIEVVPSFAELFIVLAAAGRVAIGRGVE
jgi:hypothetical protein